MRVCLCRGTPYSGCALELWAYSGLICSLTDTCTCMFSFDVSFDLLAFELILFISVLKSKLVDKSTPRYLAEDTLSRNFDGLCRSEPVHLYLTSLYTFEAYRIACQFPAYFLSRACFKRITVNRNRLRPS